MGWAPLEWKGDFGAVALVQIAMQTVERRFGSRGLDLREP
jgi:hypothetical protein